MADGGGVAGTASFPLVPRTAWNAGAASVRPPTRQRTKLWELSDSFHCSVVGTCLTAAELRKALQRECARALQKALDQRHQSVINRFAKLRDENERHNTGRRG